jgi:hypothetical protein
MIIKQINHQDAINYWPTISSFLHSAMEHGQGESTLVDYLRKILNNAAQCWVVLDTNNTIVGAGLTEFMQYNQHRTLHIIAFGGSNFEEQSKVFPAVEQFAKDNNCKSIEQWGREGWAKILPKYVPGFKQAYVVMRKDIQ